MPELFWAHYSKHHLDAGDTRVLATSPTPGPGDALGDLVRSMYSMNPPTRRPVPAPLPIASFGPPAPVDGRPWLAMCLVEPAEGQYDASKRLFHRASFYALTHETAARRGVTYAGLLSVALDHPLPAPTPVPLPGGSGGRVARSVVDLGAAWCLATAAALLDGPVTVRPPESSGALARAEVLDAVMAFLPYGYRTSVLAATHAEPGPYRTRLSFAADGLDAPAPRSPEALAYHAVLEKLVLEHTAPTVVEFLAADPRPRDIDDPAATAGLADEVAALGASWAEAQAGRLAPEQARAWLTSGPDLPDGIAGLLLTAALHPWDDAARAWLATAWGGPVLAAVASALPGWPPDQAAAAVGLARDRGRLGDLADELVSSGTAFGLLYDTPDTLAWYEVLAAGSDLPGFADALRRVLDASDEVTAGSLKRVSRPGGDGGQDPEALARILAVAAARGRLDSVSQRGWEVLAVVAGHIAALGRLAAEVDGGCPLADVLRSVAHERVLLADGLTAGAAGRYLAEFLAACRTLADAGWPSPTVADVAEAAVVRWRDRPDAAAWALLLAAGDHDRDTVAACVVEAVRDRPELLDGAGPWDQVEDLAPALRALRAARVLAEMLSVPDMPPAQVGDACRAAVTAGMPATDVLAEVRSWPAAADPPNLDAVLWGMASDLADYFVFAHAVWSAAGWPAGARHRAWSCAVADRRLAEAATHIEFARGVHGWERRDDG
ncbi:hypothetical protein [Actinophytocola oryzae]|uniref:Uncharacterized protein n=1 Tax=Actinophytocola oryzae TaxID=502181 RepID=A0A4R7V0P6_9PSEU|nr:hypothetical protein [Actinophytocola oryzae]TDV40976.1 hypothetical protein CLV71_12142 [Actinophytocola oryzae]